MPQTPQSAADGGVDLFEIAGIDPTPKKAAQAPAGDVDLFELGGISIDVPRPKPQGIGGYVADAVSDFFKRGAGAALSGIASIPEAVQSGLRATVRSGAGGDPATVMPGGAFIPGIDTDEAINGPMTQQQRDRRELQAERMAVGVRLPGAEALARAGRNAHKAINDTTSQATQDAVANSQISGNLLKGEIDFGKDPSVRGFLMQGADVFGSMFPVVATALATRSPGAAGAVGGAMAAGEGVENAREFIAKQSHEQLLDTSPLYRRMIDAGAAPDEARRITSAKAEDASALVQGAVATFGDRFTGKLVTGGLDPLLARVAGRSVLGKTAAGAGISGLEEGTQELAEGVASDLGTKSVVQNKEIGEDSAANFVLGALGGSAPGAARGVVAGIKDRGAKADSGKRNTVIDVTYNDAKGKTVTDVATTADASPGDGAAAAPAPQDQAPAPAVAEQQRAQRPDDTPASAMDEITRLESVRDAQQPDGAPESMDSATAATRLAELEVMDSTAGLNPVQQQERAALARRLEQDTAREAGLEDVGEAPQALAADAAPVESAEQAHAFDPGAVQAKTWPQFVLERGEKIATLRRGTPAWEQLQQEWAAVKTRRAGTNPEGTGAAGTPAQEIQNRDRSRPASVVQMQGMAQSPDYLRLGVSRSPESGAPMVFAVGDQADAAQALGRADVAVMSDGQRVPFRYAVMEAADVQPSNFADGAVNPLFDAAHPGTVKALNNGRTAGLRAAYERGTAEAYRQELAADSDMHGIDPAIIDGMQAPVLVRLYSEKDNQANMGAKSQSQALGLSATEQAATDAALVDAGVLEVFDSGALDSAANRDFARAFIGKLQEQGQDVAGMVDANGALSPAGVTRLQAALVHKAYGDGDLVESLFGSTDNDIRAIGESLKAVAGEWAAMRLAAERGAINAEVDMTDNLLQAIRLVQKARRERASLYDAVQQVDMLTGDGHDALTVGMLRLLYSGEYLTRPTGRDRLVQALRAYMGAALATSVSADMFGEQVGPAAILAALSGQPITEQQTNGASTTTDATPAAQGSRQPAGSDPAGRRADESGSQARGQEPAGAGQAAAGTGRGRTGQNAQDPERQQDRQGAQGDGQDGRGAVAAHDAHSGVNLTDNDGPLRQAFTFDEARHAAKAFQGKDLTNAATGMKARVSRNSLDKMLSGKAVGKSESASTHSMAVANADRLFVNATYGWSKPDRSDDPNIRGVHRFFAPMEIGGRAKLVKLTVKESAREDRSSPLYTVEAVELNENLPGKAWLESAAREDGVSLDARNPLQREWVGEIASEAGPRATLTQPRGLSPSRSAEDVLNLARQIEERNAVVKRSTTASKSDPKARPALRDTRGTGVRLHGTSRPLPAGGPTNDGVYSGNVRNIYGQGFYTTDAADIAAGYTRKGQGGEPTVYEISERSPVRLYDMDTSMEPDVRAMAARVLDDLARDENGETGEPITTLAQLFDEARAESRYEGVSADELQERFDSIRYNLEGMGYRGFTHVGGQKTGSPAHQVNIYWYPEDDLDVTRSDLSRFEEPSGKAPAFKRGDSAVAPAMTTELAQELLNIAGGTPQSSAAARPARAVAQAQKVVDSVRAAWKNAPPVNVVFDMRDPRVPQEARDADQLQAAEGATGVPQGFYFDGEVYLVASHLETAADTVRVLYHEALGHHGLRGAFGPALDGVLDQIVVARPREIQAKLTQYGLPDDLEGRRYAAEEVLAEMAEKRPELGFVRRAVAAIRAWLRAHIPAARRLALADAEIIRDFILPARNWVERGGVVQGRASRSAVAFSLSADALAQAKAKWSAVVDQFVRGSLDETKTYEVLPSSTAVMKLVGLPDLPIRAGVHALEAVYNHGVTPRQLKQVLDELANPPLVMIWNKGRGGETSLNFVTSMHNSNGDPFVIGLKPNKGSVEGPHHWLATVTEKQPSSILGMVRDGGAVYVGSGEIAGIDAAAMRDALRFAKEKRGKEARELKAVMASSHKLPNLVQGALYAKDLEAFKAQVPAQGEGKPMFSRGPAVAPVARVQKVVDEVRKAWANAPRINVVFDMQDPRVPQEARDTERRQAAEGAEGVPKGFYFDGEVYLVASQLDTAADTVRVLYHEALGHHGLRGAFGEKLDAVLDQIIVARPREVRAKMKEYGLADDLQGRRHAAEEVLAEMAETQPQLGFVRRAVAAIRTWLRAHVPALRDLAMTDAEIIRDFILPARHWVVRGGGLQQSKGGAAFSRGQSDADKARALQGEPVAELDTEIAPMGAPAIRAWASEIFQSIGGAAYSPALGDVQLDERAVRDSLAHGRPNKYKVAAFAAVKDVLEKGVVVMTATHARTDSFFVSAPVRLSGTDHIVTALVRRDQNTQRMYLQSVATKEYLLNRRVSSVDAEASERSGSNDSGDGSIVANHSAGRKASPAEVADELQRLLKLDVGSPGAPRFSRGAPSGVASASRGLLGRPLVTHTTKSGKPLQGVVVQGMDRDTAGLYDPYTFKKDGGYFIRAKHLAAEGVGFRRGESAVAPAMTAELAQVQRVVDSVRAAWANSPPVHVVLDMQDPRVPQEARDTAQLQAAAGAAGVPQGFYFDGEVYLLASQLDTAADAIRVLYHEALGHHGLRGAFGPALDSVLDQITVARRSEVRAKMKEYGLADNLEGRRYAAEEVLAELAEQRPEMGFVRRAIAAIRAWLRAHVPAFKRLQLTDADIVAQFILPARGFVERSRAAGSAAAARTVPAYSRSDTEKAVIPDAIIGSTLGTASSHPDYAAAKAGDVHAAVRLALDLVTPELVAKVKAQVGDARPRVVPVTAEEAAGRNKIPLAVAEVLASRLGLDVETGIVQANRAHRTGMDGLDRIFAPVDFAGAAAPGPYLLVDDTLTQGGTFAALASHIREGGGTVAGVVALTGKQYSAKIQPSPDILSSLRQKHGDLENEFRAATGYGFDALTESEARYLARYEPAQRLRDRIAEEGHRGRERANEGDPGTSQVGDSSPR